MHTLYRFRRVLLATLVALATLTAGTANADMAPSPTVMHLVGLSQTVERGEPSHATFSLENGSAQPVEVFLYQAVLIEGTRFPMEVQRVEIDGRSVGRTVTVPPGATTRVTVFFQLPSTMHGRSQWQIGMRVTSDAPGRIETRPAMLSRPGDHKLSVGTAKTR